MRKRTKYILAGVVVLTVVAVGGARTIKRSSGATAVKIDTVLRRDLVASVTASGQVQAHTKVDISSDISGRITRLAVKEGDMVQKGQFLLEIDPSSYRAAVERAEASVAASQSAARQSKASLTQAQRDYDRMAALKKLNSALVTDEKLEQLQTQVEIQTASFEDATHNVAGQEGALRDAQSALARTTIVAPIAGRITRLAVGEGEGAIQGNLNRDAATLLTISDMSELETKVNIDQSDVARIRIGDSAIVTLDAFPDSTFRGRVTNVSNSSVVNGQAVSYQVTVTLFDVPPQTRPNFTATAKIITDTRRQALAIPIIALTVRDNVSAAGKDRKTQAGSAPQAPAKRDAEGVFVIGKDNRVAFRPVKIGITGENYFEVLSGVQQGERIVGGTYQAIRELQDGAIVTASDGILIPDGNSSNGN